MFPIRLAGGLFKAVSDKLADGSLPVGGVLGQNVVDIANRLPFGLAGKFLGDQNPIGGVVGGSFLDQLKDKGITEVGGSFLKGLGNLIPVAGLAGQSVSNALGNGNVITGGGGADQNSITVEDAFGGVVDEPFLKGLGNSIPFAGKRAFDEGTMTDGSVYESPFDFLKRTQTRELEDNRRQQPFWEFKEETGGSYSDYLRSILGRRQVEESVDRLGLSLIHISEPTRPY